MSFQFEVMKDGVILEVFEVPENQMQFSIGSNGEIPIKNVDAVVKFRGTSAIIEGKDLLVNKVKINQSAKLKDGDLINFHGI